MLLLKIVFKLHGTSRTFAIFVRTYLYISEKDEAFTKLNTHTLNAKKDNKLTCYKYAYTMGLNCIVT